MGVGVTGKTGARSFPVQAIQGLAWIAARGQWAFTCPDFAFVPFRQRDPADALMRSPIDGYGRMMHIDDDGLCKKIMVDERRFRVLWNL